MYPLTLANTHHEVKDFEIHGILRKTKTLNISKMEHDLLMFCSGGYI